MSEADSAFEHGNAAVEQGDLARAERAYAEPTRADTRPRRPSSGCSWSIAGRAPALEAYRRADERGNGLGAFRLGLLLAGGEDWQGANDAWARADERGSDQPGLDIDALLRSQGRPTADAAPAAARHAFANPVLVGAVTVLAVLVAVFLAYNANQGLPFVPTRELKVGYCGWFECGGG